MGTYTIGSIISFLKEIGSRVNVNDQIPKLSQNKGAFLRGFKAIIYFLFIFIRLDESFLYRELHIVK